MKNLVLSLCVVLFFSCNDKKVKSVSLSANDIINKAIEASGGELYEKSKICFKFRGLEYVSEEKGKVQKRSFFSDSINYIDIKRENNFERFVNDIPVIIPDSLATLYSNSLNSVHYFAQLPYHLNDAAVHKEFLKEESIGEKNYYVIKATFDKKGGGTDFEDTYLYWVNKKTFKVDYLAYNYHTNGGGIRFRKAYNERYVNGIRFVDYENYKPKNSKATLMQMSELFKKNELELLSKIDLENIEVNRSI